MVLVAASAAAQDGPQAVDVTAAEIQRFFNCDYGGVQALVRPPVPRVHVPRPDLSQYDALLSGNLRG